MNQEERNLTGKHRTNKNEKEETTDKQGTSKDEEEKRGNLKKTYAYSDNNKPERRRIRR